MTTKLSLYELKEDEVEALCLTAAIYIQGVADEDNIDPIQFLEVCQPRIIELLRHHKARDATRSRSSAAAFSGISKHK